MLRAAAATEGADEGPFSLLFRPVFFSPALRSSATSLVDLFELSAGTEGFEDDRRRWWSGLKGCCAVLSAARPRGLAGAAVMELAERKALPSAGENMASYGGVRGLVMAGQGWARLKPAGGRLRSPLEKRDFR
jgi:hypothetical protein